MKHLQEAKIRRCAGIITRPYLSESCANEGESKVCEWLSQEHSTCCHFGAVSENDCHSSTSSLPALPGVPISHHLLAPRIQYPAP